MNGVDLAQWLGAQLDADAATVGAVRPDPSLRPHEPIEFILAGQDITVPSTEAAERHIREFASPARVLREIEADRILLAEYERAANEYPADSRAYDHESTVGRERTATLEWVIRLRATRFSDRPGYQEGWAP